ncbi:MAG: hypothetical protein GYB64_04170, partial [Chloroflexi bacterium]|nr:hypothetical protein [Chloroflexota bacterium]
MLLILFGLPGAGKNYAGRIIAEMVDGHFHDADDDLTSEMRGYIERGEAITAPVRDRYYAVVQDRIEEVCAH